MTLDHPKSMFELALTLAERVPVYRVVLEEHLGAVR